MPSLAVVEADFGGAKSRAEEFFDVEKTSVAWDRNRLSGIVAFD
jgi:hypothetical protein